MAGCSHRPLSSQNQPGRGCLWEPAGAGGWSTAYCWSGPHQEVGWTGVPGNFGACLEGCSVGVDRAGCLAFAGLGGLGSYPMAVDAGSSFSAVGNLCVYCIHLALDQV